MTNRRTTRIGRNIWVLSCMYFLWGLVFYEPVMALFFSDIGGSAKAAMLVLAIEHGASAFFEVPTGAFADVYGRRNAFILAAVTTVLCYALYAIAQDMTFLILGSLAIGFSNALTSGADQALLFDTLKEQKREHAFKKISGRLQAAWPIGLALSAIIGSAIAAHSLRLAFVITLIPGVLLIPLSLLIVEPVYHRPQTRSFLRQSMDALRTVFSRRQILLLFAIEIFGWATSQAIFDGVPLFYSEAGVPIVLFGVIGAALFLASMTGKIFSYRVSAILNDKWTMFFMTLLYCCLWIGATYMRGFFIIIPLAFTSLFSGIRMPSEQHLINLHAPDHLRATLLSLKSLIGRASAVLTALLVGYLIDAYSAIEAVRWMQALILISLPLMLLITAPTDRKIFGASEKSA